MDIRKEMCGACLLGNRSTYVSPEAETVDVEIRDLIAVSGDNVEVGDPWGSNTEENW